MAEFYAELPISIRITGNYHDMGAFASDVAQLPRIVTLNDVAHHQRQGHADDGGRRQDVPLSRRGRDREAAQARPKAPRTRRQEMKRVGLDLAGRRARCSPAAAARAIRICATGWREQGKGVQRQARPAAADQALRAVRLQRLRPARSVQAAQDRAGQGRQQARARPHAAQGAARGVSRSSRSTMVGTLRAGQDDVRAGAHARQGRLPGARTATTSGRTSASSSASPTARSS